MPTISQNLRSTRLAAAVLCATSVTGIAPSATAQSKGGITPALPRSWKATAHTTRIDYARSENADAWLRHPILGDPSFDSFERVSGQPVVSGTLPFLWPVNASLLDDPVSGRLYAYVGLYMEGYALNPGGPTTHCVVYMSEDRGKIWALIGPIFDNDKFKFTGDTQHSNIAPDVKVIYSGGKYHMSYDWCTDNTTWSNASNPTGDADSGCGYAWADRPEGPFHRAPNPILRTTEVQKANPTATRYRRVYATSLIRRKSDWLALIDLDSGSHFAWGQVAVTAKDPMGPWSHPTLVASLEGDQYYPAPMEAFPAFQHEGYVYDPRTSVGMNRNFQILMRAPIEKAEHPEAWSVYQHGSVWHARWRPDEAYGLWGQTLAGVVSGDGALDVLFPSRTQANGAGVIAEASRPWNKPFNARGFTLSAHGAPSITATHAAYADFKLETKFKLHGSKARFAWGFAAALGAEGRADGKPDRRAWWNQCALEIGQGKWAVVRVDAVGKETVYATGVAADSPEHRITIERRADSASLTLDGAAIWNGETPATAAPLALLLAPGTNLEVLRFEVNGKPQPATHLWLASEAISGAGVAEGSYSHSVGAEWHAGSGCICTSPFERVKWNFRGNGFRLWMPVGPDYGVVTVLVDGVPAGEINLHATKAGASKVVLERTDLVGMYHAVTLKSDKHALPLDCLEAIQP